MPENLNVENYTASVFQKTKDLIREKTRFEPEEVQKNLEQESLQLFSLAADHTLRIHHQTANITGRFLKNEPGEKVVSDDAAKASVMQGDVLLKSASEQLSAKITESGTKYNFVSAGLYLAHRAKYYSLETCHTCVGRGKNDCIRCYTTGQISCSKCSGVGRHTCDAYGCLYGRTQCSSCNGQGQTYRQVATQVWSNSTNSYVTTYQSVYETCYACTGGRVMCNRCYGTSQVNCIPCAASGKVICGSCSGLGHITCSPCEGSGETGAAYWSDINISTEYHLHLPDGAEEAAVSIQAKEGPHGIVPISEKFNYSSLLMQGVFNSNIQAHYDGAFKVAHLDATCGGADYHIVAYGNDLRWLTLDGIIERLVENDVTHLEKVLIESKSQSFVCVDIDDLFEATNNVIASEVNADVIDADFSQEKAAVSKDALSAEFSQKIKMHILEAISLMYVRLAKKFWWKLAIMVFVIYLAAWFADSSSTGLLASLVATFAGWMVFQRHTQKLLESKAIEARHGRWMADTAKRTGCDKWSSFIVVLPSILMMLTLAVMLPQYSVQLQKRFFGQSVQTQAHVRALLAISIEKMRG